MESLPTLEQTLTMWAQEMIQQLMQPTYLGLLRLLIAELPRFPQLGALFTQAIPEQGGAFLKDLLTSACEHGIIEADDLALSLRLLVGPLLTYVLGSGLLAPGGSSPPPPSEQVAALVRLAPVGLPLMKRNKAAVEQDHSNSSGQEISRCFTPAPDVLAEKQSPGLF